MKIQFPKFKNLFVLAAAATTPVVAGAVDIHNIPGPNGSTYVEYGAFMPYTRYEAEDAARLGSASLKESDVYSSDWKAMQRNIATQASDRKYVELPSSGAGVEWTAVRSGNAVTLRFTMPDSHSGTDGLRGSLDFYVNGQKRRVRIHGTTYDNIPLSSYWMWQYFSSPTEDYWASHNASDTWFDGAFPAFAFDEVGFLVEDGDIQKGDRISVRSSGANGHVYGVDFIEVEKAAKKECPAGYAQFNGGDLQSFINSNSNIYIPEGVYYVGGKLNFNGKNITGAGIFYTNIHFTASWGGGGGIQCGGGELSDIHLTSNLNSRLNQQANYKGLEAGPHNLLAHDLWVQHFECGAWFEHGDNIKVVSCRLRDNFADGLNYCMTSNSSVYNCSVRNNGDDGLAMWNHNYNSGDEYNNTFCYNTIELGWRAGLLGVFGGNGHRVYNNYLRDAVCSAGIRVTSDFPGHKFVNSENNIICDNVLVSCGTQHDIFGGSTSSYNINGSGRLPSIYVHGSNGNVKGFRFSNNRIYNSQAEEIAILGDVTGIDYNNCANAARPGDEAPGYPPVDDEEDVDSPYADYTGHDLHLVGLQWTTSYRSGEFNQNDEITFTYRIKNIGSAHIPEDATVKIRHQLTVDGTTVHSGTMTDGLASGSHKDISVRWLAKDAGKHIVKATVSVSGLGGEDTTNNSSEEKRINVNEGTKEINWSYEKSSGLDLTVTDITWENLDREDGRILENDRLLFTAYVVNSGEQPTPGGSTKIGLKFLLDGRDYDTGHITWDDEYSDKFYGSNIPVFQPGKRIVMTANGGGGQHTNSDGQNYHRVSAGSHTITAFIDDSSLLNESNEGNNKLTVTLPTVPYYGVEYFSPEELSMPDSFSGTTAIDNTETDSNDEVVIHDLYGRRITAPFETLPRGIYIVNGKKIAK